MRLLFMTDPGRFQVKLDKSTHWVRPHEHCFHEIARIFWNRSDPHRILRPGKQLHAEDFRKLHRTLKKNLQNVVDYNPQVPVQFSHKCGSPIYSKAPKSQPNITVVKLRLFTGEIDQLPCPMKDLFCGRMMKWEEEIDDAKYYNESAE
ncbi:unnamed protein product [Adineta ricciae]|uniref:Uncharacterized protein n=1 Tax=Adineta ricciae TaxID=249248 RepID=A0A815PC77_ADIRI|nr:unnamed protein product [Adineta ricciae]